MGVPKKDCGVFPSAVDSTRLSILLDNLLLRRSKTSRLAFIVRSHNESVPGRVIHAWVVAVHESKVSWALRIQSPMQPRMLKTSSGRGATWKRAAMRELDASMRIIFSPQVIPPIVPGKGLWKWAESTFRFGYWITTCPHLWTLIPIEPGEVVDTCWRLESSVQHLGYNDLGYNAILWNRLCQYPSSLDELITCLQRFDSVESIQCYSQGGL